MSGPYGVTALTIIVPMAPDACLLPNNRRKAGRAYWSQSEATAHLRQAAKLAAVSQRNTCGGGPIFRTPVKVCYRVIWPFARYKRALKIPDPDAIPTACKAILDGIVDAGILPDDSPEYVDDPSVLRHRGERHCCGARGDCCQRVREGAGIVSERQTGASPEQIEAAVQQRYTLTSAAGMGIPWARLNSLIRRSMAACFERDAARYLVPVGQVITDAARVPTDDEMDAIRVLVADDGVPAESDEWFAAFDTLRAYLERQR